MDALDSPHMHVFVAMVEGTEAVEVPAGRSLRPWRQKFKP